MAPRKLLAERQRRTLASIRWLSTRTGELARCESAVIGQAHLPWLTTRSWRDGSLATCLTEPPTRGFIMPVATSAYAAPRFV
jgi:hypothetical protein